MPAAAFPDRTYGKRQYYADGCGFSHLGNFNTGFLYETMNSFGF